MMEVVLLAQDNTLSDEEYNSEILHQYGLISTGVQRKYYCLQQ